jgi:peptidoglycan/LPS O-acetylase OafA/YrhL
MNAAAPPIESCMKGRAQGQKAPWCALSLQAMPHGTTAPSARPSRIRRIRAGAGAAGDARYIPEIDGLRGVAIALVVVYHIWFNRVSGGVDVFLMLSGLLITLSLTRRLEREGRIGVLGFYARTARRIVPPAMAVLAGVVVATVLWLPQVRWRETLGDVVAAALYWVNWRLAGNAVDYLDSQNAASPVQHYWSLAIQGQFYLLWPAVIALAGMLAVLLGVRLRRAVAVLLAGILAVSLVYSVLTTADNQAFAYFDTGARLYEFALGGLLGLAGARLRPGPMTRLIMGWLALAALVSCGMVFSTGTEFPGAAALWPTLAACALVACAGGGERGGVDRLLRTAALRRLGEVSYALYLWHWPVLICYLAETGRTVPSLTGGLWVIATSLALAVATHWLLERRLPGSALGRARLAAGLAPSAAFLACALLACAVWAGGMALQQQREAEAAAQAGPHSHPGAAVLAGDVEEELPARPVVPSALEAKEDLPEVYDLGCHQDQEDASAEACTFGVPADEAEHTIALVGGSHAAHWLPALQAQAEEHSWRIVSMTKSACLFSAEEQTRDGEPYVSCNEWNDNVLAELERLGPDAVFTTATRVGGGSERTPEGYVEQWRVLERMGLPVVAVRDTPWPMLDVPECVDEHGPDDRRCGRDRAEMFPGERAEVETRADLPGNVDFADLTDLLCDDVHCPAVVGNVLVYRDNSHLTTVYAETLAPYLAERMPAELTDG